MNSNRLIVLSIGIALSFPQGTRAQSLDDYSALRTELDAMFEDLDKTKIITGLLLDKGTDLQFGVSGKVYEAYVKEVEKQ